MADARRGKHLDLLVVEQRVLVGVGDLADRQSRPDRASSAPGRTGSLNPAVTTCSPLDRGVRRQVLEQHLAGGADRGDQHAGIAAAVQHLSGDGVGVVGDQGDDRARSRRRW